MNSTIFINKHLRCFGDHGFNIFIQKYLSEEWEQIYQFSLKNKTTGGKSAAINFPWILYESILQSLFVISSFSLFMKLIVVYVESSFHVIPYLIWKWFESLFFFYLTFIKFVSGYLYFLSNLNDIKDHI